MSGTGFLAWLAEHPQGAGVVVFLVAMAESLVVVGLLVPGALAMFAAGALIATGVLDFWLTVSWAVAGAIVGDGLSYGLGRHYGTRLRELPLLRRYASMLDRAEVYVRQHGGKSVFLARFVGPLRPLVPAVAGVLGMSPVRFFWVNVLSALCWAPAYLLPGAAFGASLGLAEAVAARLATLLAALVLAFWGGLWVLRRSIVWALPHIEQGAIRSYTWARQTHNGSIVWLRNIVVSLLDPARPEARGLAWLGVVLIVAAWIFLGVLEDIVTGDPLVRIDLWVYHALQVLRTPIGDSAMVLVTELGDAAVTLPLATGVALWLGYRRAWRALLYWFAALGFAALLTWALKAGLARPRPAALYNGAATFAFPSGHATMNIAMYGMLALMLVKEISHHWRWPLLGLMAILVGLIAFSRLYLGAHWLSDVLAGLAFGAAWIALLGIAYHRRPTPPIATWGLGVIVVLIAAIAAGAHVATQHTTDLQRYAQRHPTTTLTQAQWWSTAWKNLPAWRLDIEGEFEQPLTLQWAGSLDQVREQLVSHGWRVPLPWSAATLMLWLDVTRTARELPVVSAVHDGRFPELTLLYEISDQPSKRLIVRLWSSDTTLGDTTQPIWLGAVTQERLSQPFGGFNLVIDEAVFNRPRDVLAQSLAGVEWRVAIRTRDLAVAKQAVEWDGKVLLARMATAAKGED